MPKILTIALSILLSLGLFSEIYLPFMKEAVIGILLIYIIVNPNYHLVLLKNLKFALPLLIIFFIFIALGGILPYSLSGESVINYKFLTAIVLFIFLSTLFNIHPNFVSLSLISFGIGAGVLSMLFSIGFFGADAFQIRNDRLNLLGENPNSLSVRISLGVLFLIWGCMENKLKKGKFFQILLLIPVPFMFNLILLSGSRGSFILCVFSVVLYILFLKNVSKIFKRSIILIACILSFFILSIFTKSTMYERFLADDLSGGRNDIWESALNIFINNPFGVGELGYKIEILKILGIIIDTHNLFIYLLVTGGFISLYLFLYFLSRIFNNLYKKYKKDKSVIYFIIFFSMIFVMSKTGGVLSYLIMWYFLACINIKNVSYRNQSQKSKLF